MTGLLVTAARGGNLAVHVTVSTVPNVVHVEAGEGDRLVLELGADEPVQILLSAPGAVLVDVLGDALAAVLRHLEGHDA